MRRFRTLAAAGTELAASLSQFRGAPGANDTIVLAIMNGGADVAAAVATELNLPLEHLFIRRLLAPNGAASALCAVSAGGRLVFDEGIPDVPATPQTGMEYAIAGGLAQLQERVRTARGDRAPVELTGKTILLVDNGIHTGSTVLAAIRALRRVDVKRIVVAVPVANPATRATLNDAADEIICLQWPENFGHVGLWYEYFVGRGDKNG